MVVLRRRKVPTPSFDQEFDDRDLGSSIFRLLCLTTTTSPLLDLASFPHLLNANLWVLSKNITLFTYCRPRIVLTKRNRILRNVRATDQHREP